jgi:energy-coupling factor transport system ATP-binding protein
MEDMAQYCDRVVVMRGGEIFASGEVGEIFSRGDDLANVGLDVPQIMKIAAELKKRGITLDGKLYTVDGVRDAILRRLGKVGY